MYRCDLVCCKLVVKEQVKIISILRLKFSKIHKTGKQKINLSRVD